MVSLDSVYIPTGNGRVSSSTPSSLSWSPLKRTVGLMRKDSQARDGGLVVVVVSAAVVVVETSVVMSEVLADSNVAVVLVTSESPMLLVPEELILGPRLVVSVTGLVEVAASATLDDVSSEVS